MILLHEKIQQEFNQYVRENGSSFHSDKHRSKNTMPQVGIEPISQILVIQTSARTTELSRHTIEM